MNKRQRRAAAKAAKAAALAAGEVNAAAPAPGSQAWLQAAALLRKAHGIKVAGAGGAAAAPPPLSNAFGADSGAELRSLGVPPRAAAALAEAGLSEPTACQRQCVPALCAAVDTLCVAPTGSGKTLAFLLPAVAAMERERVRAAAAEEGTEDAKTGVVVVVLAPTAELAQQTLRELRRLLPPKPQKRVLRARLLTKATLAGVDWANEAPGALVATPARLAQALGVRIDDVKGKAWCQATWIGHGHIGPLRMRLIIGLTSLCFSK